MSLACDGNYHVLFKTHVEFVTRGMLEEMLPDWYNPLTRLLCDLPGTDFTLHCHCESSDRLECQAAKRVLQQLMSNLQPRLRVPLPWTNCCTKVAHYSVGSCSVFSVWMFSGKATEECLRPLVDFKVARVNRKYVFVVGDLQDFELRVLLMRLHACLNLPDKVGFHVGDYNVCDWKSVETSQLLSARSCALRYLYKDGQYYQERFLKNFTFRNKDF